MSGLEILGIAANVVQIADLGARLSVTLFAFSRKIKNANRSIEAISKDIAATGAVLHQLGTQLNKDENARLCSDNAMATARELVTDCQRLFQDIERAVEPTKPGQKANCSKEALQTLNDQRELIFARVGDARDSKDRFEQSQKLVTEHQPDPSNEPAAAQIYSLSTTTTFDSPLDCQVLGDRRYLVPQNNSKRDTTRTVQPKTDVAAFGFEYRKQGLLDHCILIRRLIAEIEVRKYRVDHCLRSEMCMVVLNHHWNHWHPLREIYGLDTLLEAMSQEHPEMAEFWVSKLENAVRSDGRAGSYTCKSYGCEQTFHCLDLLHRHQDQHKLEMQSNGADIHRRQPNETFVTSDQTSATMTHAAGFSTPSIVNPSNNTHYAPTIYAFQNASSDVAFVPISISEGSSVYRSGQLPSSDHHTLFAQRTGISSSPHISDKYSNIVSPLVSSTAPSWEPLITPGNLFPRTPEKDDHLMKCIYTYTDDDGSTILCKGCETWQHIKCFYLDEAEPELHLCADCEPRPLDGHEARERQKRLGAQEDIGDSRSTDLASDSHEERNKDSAMTFVDPSLTRPSKGLECLLDLPMVMKVEPDIVDQLVLQYTALTEYDLSELKRSIWGHTDMESEHERAQQSPISTTQSAELANQQKNEVVASGKRRRSSPPWKWPQSGIGTDFVCPTVDAGRPPALEDSDLIELKCQDSRNARRQIGNHHHQRRTKRRRDSPEAVNFDRQDD